MALDPLAAAPAPAKVWHCLAASSACRQGTMLLRKPAFARSSQVLTKLAGQRVPSAAATEPEAVTCTDVPLPCRNMDEMWDDTDTERCRQQFIRGMYKFPKCPTAKLAHGKPMPVLGLGPWRTAEGGVQDIVEKALRSGVRCCQACAALLSAQVSGAANLVRSCCCRCPWLAAQHAARLIDRWGACVGRRLALATGGHGSAAPDDASVCEGGDWLVSVWVRPHQLLRIRRKALGSTQRQAAHAVLQIISDLHAFMNTLLGCC